MSRPGQTELFVFGTRPGGLYSMYMNDVRKAEFEEVKIKDN